MHKFERLFQVAASIFLALLATAIAAQAQTFTSLAKLAPKSGTSPLYESLVQGTDGNLYGTASASGAYGYGTVFKVTPSGALTVLYNFCAVSDCLDGRFPEGGLTLGTDENFYGTTAAGGPYNSSCGGGCGTVFKITRQGVLTTLHTFDFTDGYVPSGALVQGTDGNFYGTTLFGGTDDSCKTIGSEVGCGTIFKITPEGRFTTLHSFVETDGWEPIAGLIEATDGNFYGTTYLGGANDRGAVFKVTPEGDLTTLHSFCALAHCADGDGPYAALVEASNGDFYGTTLGGGTNTSCDIYNGDQCGTVFRITSAGMLTTLTDFLDYDGWEPFGPLIQATDGNLYGTTGAGFGTNCPAYFNQGCGTVFEITPQGVLTDLHSFGYIDGAVPVGGLFQATNGLFYGTTVDGGGLSCSPWGCGTVFSESVGLGPFVMTVPTARKVGQGVIILGNGLEGSTSVTFNGAPATFKVVSATEISTTVPAGATTGTVQVITPGGPLSSNVPFKVVQ